MVKYLKEADSETFKCKICNQIFCGVNRPTLKLFCRPVKYYLTQHNKKAHHLVNHDVDMVKYLKEADLETFKFAISICNEIFSGEDADWNLANHLVSKCKKNELFSCNSCHKKFTTKYNLEKHTNVFHTGEQEVFECENCSYTTKH